MRRHALLCAVVGVLIGTHAQTAGLLAERLQAWKHAVGYLEDYMEAMEKIHSKHAKEYERALKVNSAPS